MVLGLTSASDIDKKYVRFPKSALFFYADAAVFRT
jgi:hypothetical protein